MKGQSLQEVMNTVCAHLDAIDVQDDTTDAQCSNYDVLTELEAFACFDPLLADLQKQYLDCKARRHQQAAQFGEDSPMLEVALEVEDSAWCAMQACYLELRQDRGLMARVQDFMRTRQREMDILEEKQKAEKEREKIRMFLFLSDVSKMIQKRRREDNPSIFEWLLLFMIWKIGPFAQSFSLSQSYRPASGYA